MNESSFFRNEANNNIVTRIFVGTYQETDMRTFIEFTSSGEVYLSGIVFENIGTDFGQLLTDFVGDGNINIKLSINRQNAPHIHQYHTNHLITSNTIFLWFSDLSGNLLSPDENIDTFTLTFQLRFEVSPTLSLLTLTNNLQYSNTNIEASLSTAFGVSTIYSPQNIELETNINAATDFENNFEIIFEPATTTISFADLMASEWNWDQSTVKLQKKSFLNTSDFDLYDNFVVEFVEMKLLVDGYAYPDQVFNVQKFNTHNTNSATDLNVLSNLDSVENLEILYDTSGCNPLISRSHFLSLMLNGNEFFIHSEMRFNLVTTLIRNTDMGAEPGAKVIKMYSTVINVSSEIQYFFVFGTMLMVLTMIIAFVLYRLRHKLTS